VQSTGDSLESALEALKLLNPSEGQWWIRKSLKIERSILRLLIVIAGSSMSLNSVAAHADSAPKDRTEICRQSWQVLSGQFKENYQALKGEWSKLATQCQGTGLYEYHWGSLLERTGSLKEAIEYFGNALKQDIADKDEIRVSYVSYRFSDALLVNEHDTNRLRGIHQEIADILQAHPNNPSALTEEARQLVALKDYGGALTAAKRAADLDANSWPARMWLVVAAAHTGDCRLAKPYIVPTIKTRGDALLAQQDFMYAAVSCYLATGEVSTAENAIRALAKNNSAVKQDPVFLRLVNDVLAAKRAQQSAPQ